MHLFGIKYSRRRVRLLGNFCKGFGSSGLGAGGGGGGAGFIPDR